MDLHWLLLANNVKKMYLKNNDGSSKNNIVDFTLPRLHKGIKACQWYVDFYAYDPVSDKMKRKKYMLGRIKTIKGREDMAAILIHNIYSKLIIGWNPFVSDSNNVRKFTDFLTVLARYSDFVKTSLDKKTIKKKTATDYLSRLKQFKTYVSESGHTIKYVYQFDTALAVDFLDYLIYDKDVSAKTRNNYRTWLSTFCSWMIERRYIDENPIESIHMIKEAEKFRDPLTPGALTKVRDYAQKNNPPFYLACMMEYYTMIRPDELRYITIGDISVEHQSVYVNPTISKNRKGQSVALNDAVLKIMIAQGVFDHPSHEYLFGHNLTPSDRQININQFRLEWKKLRIALHFPDSYQFYSLKDSGIRDLANAEGIVVARDQARHSDVAVTNKYLKSPNAIHEETKHFKGVL